MENTQTTSYKAPYDIDRLNKLKTNLLNEKTRVENDLSFCENLAFAVQAVLVICSTVIVWYCKNNYFKEILNESVLGIIAIIILATIIKASDVIADARFPFVVEYSRFIKQNLKCVDCILNAHEVIITDTDGSKIDFVIMHDLILNADMNETAKTIVEFSLEKYAWLVNQPGFKSEGYYFNIEARLYA